jgi:hypothetical protein
LLFGICCLGFPVFQSPLLHHSNTPRSVQIFLSLTAMPGTSRDNGHTALQYHRHLQLSKFLKKTLIKTAIYRCFVNLPNLDGFVKSLKFDFCAFCAFLWLYQPYIKKNQIVQHSYRTLRRVMKPLLLMDACR